MKKFYFFGILSALLLTMFVTPAKANVTSMTDLFGKYNFTATLEVLDNSYASLFKSECEVTISKNSGFYEADIMGLGGATVAQSVSGIDTQAKTFTVVNPNAGNGLWSGSPVFVSNAEGKNPFGSIQRDFEFVYSYNDETKEITLPDFTVVTVADYESDDATVVARFSNVKLTLVEAENVEVPDVTGDWEFTSSYYDEESTFPHEFSVALAKRSDDNKNYAVTFDIEGYDAVTTTATFNGVTLSIEFDSLFLDREENIFFSNYAGSTTKGKIDFSYNSSTSMALTSGMSFIKLTTTTDEDGNEKVEAEQLQWFGMGVMKLASDAPAFDWAGRYTVNAERIIATEGVGFEEMFPATFDFVVEYSEQWDMYLITEVMGNSVVDLNYGGIEFKVAEDGMSATIKAGTYLAMLSESPMVFACLYDGDGETGAIGVRRAEDGTITIDPMFIQTVNYDTNETTPAVFYQNITATIEAAVPFSWDGAFAVTADVESFDEAGSYPAEFAMNVVYSEYSGGYYVTTFLGHDVSGMTYGGLPLTISEDGKSATMALSGNFGVAIVTGEYPEYIQLTDANGGTNSLTLTLNGDGTLSVSDFALHAYNYEANVTGAKLAAYSNVSASMSSAGSFTWAGDYLLSITMPDAYYADEYKVKIIYQEVTDSYYVTEFMFGDLGELNYGGLLLTIDANDPTKATIKLNGAYGVALVDMLSNGNYTQLLDGNGEGVSLGVTLNADGTLTIDPFQLVEFSFETFGAVGEPVAYPAGTAVKGGVTTDIEVVAEDVTVEDGKVNLNSNAPVAVYDAAGRKVYAGAANELPALNSGVYIIKSGNASMKLFVK